MLRLSSDIGSALSASVAFSETCRAMASYTISKDLGSSEMLFEVPYKARYYSYAGKHHIFPCTTARMEAARSSHFLNSRTYPSLKYFASFLSFAAQLTDYGSEASLAIDHIEYFHGRVVHRLRFIAIHLHKAGKGKPSKVSHVVRDLAIVV